MKEVIIHIGLHKTGSTAIQLALRHYRDDTTRYACFTEQNHSIPMCTIFAKNIKSHHFYKNWAISEKQIKKRKKIFKAELEYDLNDPSLQQLIISGEDISSLDADDKIKMLNFFKLHNWNCKILCFVRNQIEWAASAASTIIELSENPKNLNINFKERLLPFIDNLGLQNVYVFDYSNLVKNNINLIDFVSKFLNIKLTTNKIKNESLSLEAIAIIFKLNNLPINFKGHQNYMLARKKLVEKIISFFALNKGFQKLDPLIFAGLVSKEIVEENNQWLKKLFGIEYSFNANDYNNHQDISKYFEEVLNRNTELLEEFFSDFKISFNTSISLEQNLTNLFVNQLEKITTFDLWILFNWTIIRIIKKYILKFKIILKIQNYFS